MVAVSVSAYRGAVSEFGLYEGEGEADTAAKADFGAFRRDPDKFAQEKTRDASDRARRHDSRIATP